MDNNTCIFGAPCLFTGDGDGVTLTVMTERPTGTDYDYCTHTILHMSEWVFVHKKNYGP